MPRPDIHRLLEFQRLLLAFQSVDRSLHLPETFQHRRENDTEHSYNLALTAWYLASHFPELDKDAVLRIALAHDMVEIHAGDTYVYADASITATKQEREAKAFEQLRMDWPDFPDLAKTIEQYESRESAEAKFVYALDKIMPIMLNYLSEGYTWKKQGITPRRLHVVKHEKVALSPEIKPYYDQLYDLLLQKPEFFPPATA